MTNMRIITSVAVAACLAFKLAADQRAKEAKAASPAPASPSVRDEPVDNQELAVFPGPNEHPAGLAP